MSQREHTIQRKYELKLQSENERSKGHVMQCYKARGVEPLNDKNIQNAQQRRAGGRLVVLSWSALFRIAPRVTVSLHHRKDVTAFEEQN